MGFVKKIIVHKFIAFNSKILKWVATVYTKMIAYQPLSMLVNAKKASS